MLSVVAMSDIDIVKESIRVQLFNLQGLLSYLEDRPQLQAKEYAYCEAKLTDTVKHLRRLERILSIASDRS